MPAMLHIDGDAFFASCEQSRDPRLAGKPVITGRERGIAASMSYEAKARGVTRAMPLFEIRRICPDVIILPSDYETYGLLSKKFFAIVRRFTPDVEEYGVDECFADITGLQRVHHASERAIAERIQRELAVELGFSFSIGLAPTKVLAKVGSKWSKPHGLTVIEPADIHAYLRDLPAEKVWGIGLQTAARLAQYGITTAGQFARMPEAWVRGHVTKPHVEIWQELNGRPAIPLVLKEKTSYQSIQKFKTFTPPSSDRTFIFAQLVRNLENACAKARRFHRAACEAVIVLRTQRFRHAVADISLPMPSALPSEMALLVQDAFDRIYRPGTPYRATGVALLKLAPEAYHQPDLFGAVARHARIRDVYAAVDALNHKYGKYTVHLTASTPAHRFAQHEGERGDAPGRKAILFKGETSRQRLAIPLLWWKV